MLAKLTTDLDDHSDYWLGETGPSCLAAGHCPCCEQLCTCVKSRSPCLQTTSRQPWTRSAATWPRKSSSCSSSGGTSMLPRRADPPERQPRRAGACVATVLLAIKSYPRAARIVPPRIVQSILEPGAAGGQALQQFHSALHWCAYSRGRRLAMWDTTPAMFPE